MIYEIESDFLSADSRQMLAKILAEHFAGIADKQEREAQAALRLLADARPAPDDRLRAAVEADRTPYIPGIKRGKRTITLGVENRLVVPTHVDCGTFTSPTAPPPAPPEQKGEQTGFLDRLWHGLKRLARSWSICRLEILVRYMDEKGGS